MKINIFFTKQVLLVIFLVVCFHLEIFSQGTTNTKIKKTGFFFGLGAGMAQTHIINEGNISLAGLQSKEMNAEAGSFEIGYYFTRHFGLSTGVDYSSYKTELNLDTYQNKFDAIDSENEPYEHRATGTAIKEVQNISFVSVPIYLNFRLPFSKSFGLFLQVGANVSVPISNSYSSSGIFTYKGYYSAYNVLLEDLPDFGFPSNHSTISSGELKLQQYNINANASAGFDIFILKKIQLVFAATYSKSLSDISAYDSQDKFQLSSNVDQMNSLMGGSKVSLESMGVKFSLRYYFKSQY